MLKVMWQVVMFGKQNGCLPNEIILHIFWFVVPKYVGIGGGEEKIDKIPMQKGNDWRGGSHV